VDVRDHKNTVQKAHGEICQFLYSLEKVFRTKSTFLILTAQRKVPLGF